jgi:hypothetical protein
MDCSLYLGWRRLTRPAKHLVCDAAYAEKNLDALAKNRTHDALSAAVSCVFDNTAVGTATLNAGDVLGRLTKD